MNMKYEDIKNGLRFPIELEVCAHPLNDSSSIFCSARDGHQYLINPEMILEAFNKQSFSKPRFFRKGDIVRYVPTGRSLFDSRYYGLNNIVVTKDETNMVVQVSNEKNEEAFLDFFELELIKSIEEIKTAKLCTIEENSDAWIVKRNGLEMASFTRFTEGEESDKAKRFAEDYCAELNKGN